MKLWLPTQTIVYILFTLAVLVRGGCVPGDCGDHGTCRNQTVGCVDACKQKCYCDIGWTGSTCRVQIDVCPGTVDPGDTASTCFHGGTCVTNGTGYQCNCSTATGGIYVGYQCEYMAKNFCIQGATSTDAFCVNNGTCKEIISQGQTFPGCNCLDGFTGTHCEYEATTQMSDGGSSNGIKGGAVVVVVVIVLLATVGIVLFVCRRKKKTTTSATSTKDANDLQLQEAAEDKGEMI